jgi:hypothetical protein
VKITSKIKLSAPFYKLREEPFLTLMLCSALTRVSHECLQIAEARDGVAPQCTSPPAQHAAALCMCMI